MSLFYTDDERTRIRLPLKLLMIVSGTVLCFILAKLGSHTAQIACVSLCLLLLSWLCFRQRMLERTFSDFSLPRALIALVIVLCALPLLNAVPDNGFTLLKYYMQSYIAQTPQADMKRLEQFEKLLSNGCLLLAAPSLFVYAYMYLRMLGGQLKRIIRRMDNIDRIYMAVAGILAAVLVIVAFQSSNAYYGSATSDDRFDIIYTSDSSKLYRTDVYTQINASENDIRQPLFAVFSLPIAAVCKQLSAPFGGNAYPIILGIVSAWMILLCVIILRQLLEFRGLAAVFFLTLATSVYPTLLFMLMQEQYVFSVFWLLLLINAYMYEGYHRSLLYSATAGSLLTSIVALPLVESTFNLKRILLQALRALGCFISVWILFGRIGGLLDAIASVKWLVMMFVKDAPETFSVPHAPIDRLMQYSRFISSCFTAPEAYIESARHGYITYRGF